RKIDFGTRRELLFAVQDPAGVLSDNFYAVSLEGEVAIRRATRSDWLDAKEMPTAKRIFLSRSLAITGGDLASYNGRGFAKTGRWWSEPVALVSSEGKWLATFSYDTSESMEVRNPPDPVEFIAGGEP